MRSQGSRRENFDPYHKWLSIPLAKRPPTYYQLLGISPDEQDRVVIEAATARQSAFVARFRGGEDDRLAVQLLFEIEQARFELLNPDLRCRYDPTLKRTRKGRKGPRRFVQDVPLPSSEGRAVGEGSELVRDYLGIVSVILAAFVIMAVISFYLPWEKLTNPNGGRQGALTADAGAPVFNEPPKTLPQAWTNLALWRYSP